MIPALSPDLKAVLRKAVNKQLPKHMTLEPGMFTEDANEYAIGYAMAYLFGDVDEGLKRLMGLKEALEGMKSD